jgi:riboflavin kinase/FMN adenylyltransferase
LDQKARLLSECGVDVVIAYPTDQSLLNLTPDAFFEGIVRGELNARGLVEGPNFFFGHDRAGNIPMLRRLCEVAGLTLDVVPPVTVGERLVSSSEIRALIAAGRVADAVNMLGHPYHLRGFVVRGAGRGRMLGVPTANLERIETLIPPDGVYAGTASHGDRSYPAAVHIGANTTFGEQERKVEVHLLDFAGNLYGQTVEVGLLRHIRDTVKFAEGEELKRQLARDLEQVRQVWQQ